MMLPVTVWIEDRLVTDGRTDTGPWHIPRYYNIAP